MPSVEPQDPTKQQTGEGNDSCNQKPTIEPQRKLSNSSITNNTRYNRCLVYTSLSPLPRSFRNRDQQRAQTSAVKRNITSMDNRFPDTVNLSPLKKTRPIVSSSGVIKKGGPFSTSKARIHRPRTTLKRELRPWAPKQDVCSQERRIESRQLRHRLKLKYEKYDRSRSLIRRKRERSILEKQRNEDNHRTKVQALRLQQMEAEHLLRSNNFLKKNERLRKTSLPRKSMNQNYWPVVFENESSVQHREVESLSWAERCASRKLGVERNRARLHEQHMEKIRLEEEALKTKDERRLPHQRLSVSQQPEIDTYRKEETPQVLFPAVKPVLKKIEKQFTSSIIQKRNLPSQCDFQFLAPALAEARRKDWHPWVVKALEQDVMKNCMRNPLRKRSLRQSEACVVSNASTDK